MSIDPMRLLANYIVKDFLRANLAAEEKEFIKENAGKHRKSFWITAIAMIFIISGLRQLDGGQLGVVVSALIAPVMLLGSAWFAISFGGIPAKLMNIALSITFYMFTAFLVALATMFIAIAFISPPIMYPVYILIFSFTVLSCIQYDCADALKVGLDEALLKHSRAALRFYKEKEGITIEGG